MKVSRKQQYYCRDIKFSWAGNLQQLETEHIFFCFAVESINKHKQFKEDVIIVFPRTFETKMLTEEAFVVPKY